MVFGCWGYFCSSSTKEKGWEKRERPQLIFNFQEIMELAWRQKENKVFSFQVLLAFVAKARIMVVASTKRELQSALNATISIRKTYSACVKGP